MDNKKEAGLKGTKLLYMAGTARAPIPLQQQLESYVIGQTQAISRIIPFIQTYMVGLSPENRPAANILLCGNTGLGKTSTVESLAEIMHGNAKSMLRVDCGEFQADHEVAKLIGAPPGYLGHRETQPLFTQQKINSIRSEKCKLSFILFDEIEKASRGLTQILLGIMDKATLRLGDSTVVDFTDSIIFMSSNLGAKQINEAIREKIGYDRSMVSLTENQIKSTIERQVKRHFSVEFYNRLDEVCYYFPFSDEALQNIVTLEMERLQRHYNNRLGIKSFMLGMSDAMFDFLQEKGTSPEYGARELKRTIYHYVTQEIVALLQDNAIAPGSVVLMDRVKNETRISVLIDYSDLPEDYLFFDRKLSQDLQVVDDDIPKRKRRKTSAA